MIKSYLSNFSITPLALAICVSPLVLLTDTNMTRLGTLPSWTSLASHVCQGVAFPSLSDGGMVMENAILHVVVKTCQRGSLAVGDLAILNNAWRYIQDSSSPLSNAPCPPNIPHPPTTSLPNTPQSLGKQQGKCSQPQTDDRNKRHKTDVPATMQGGQTKKTSKKKKKPALTEDEPMSEHLSREEVELQRFTAGSHIPDLKDIESWPELVIPDTAPPSPSPTPATEPL